MDGLVEAVSNATGLFCTRDCNKDGCSISVRTATPKKILIDLDRSTLHIPRNQKRCDYVFIGEKNKKSWIVPIELKSSTFKAADVPDQLQGGADEVDTWLPSEAHFLFVPVLVHGESSGITRELRKLRSAKVTMRRQTGKVLTTSCGKRLKDLLDKST